MEKQYQYNSVEEALEELRQGRIVLVTDDPDRENEGDMICAAEFATQENINFMACHAKGLICTPMSAALAGRLGLSQMVSKIQITIRLHLRYPLTMWIRQREFQRRARIYYAQPDRRRNETAGPSKTGACISAGGKAWRCVGKKWSYRGNG